MKHKNLRILFYLIAVVIIMALVLPACAPAEKPAPTLEPMTITFATYLPPAYTFFWEPFEIFTKEIEEKSGGKITFDVHGSGTLLEAKACLPGLLEGTADMIQLPTIYLQGSYPILLAVSLPLVWDDADHFIRAMKIGSPLYNFFNNEMAKHNIYSFHGACDTSEMFWSHVPIRKPDDLKGLNVRASGAAAARESEAYGASPVSMPSGEMYLALERGVLDVAFASVSTARARSIQDIIKYCTYHPFHFYGSTELIMRADWFNGLSDEARKIIMDAGRIYQAAEPGAMDSYNEEALVVLKEGGVEFIELSKEEVAVFKAKSQPVWDWWKGEVGAELGATALKHIEDAR